MSDPKLEIDVTPSCAECGCRIATDADAECNECSDKQAECAACAALCWRNYHPGCQNEPLVVKPADPGLLDDLNRRVAELEGTLASATERIAKLTAEAETLGALNRDAEHEAASARSSADALLVRIAALETTVANLRADLRSRGPESKRVGGRKR